MDPLYVTEATDLGAAIEHVRHHAGHADARTTERYSRGGERKAATVAVLRAEGRQTKEK